MSPLFVAIDTPDLARARTLATAVRAHVGGVKLGLEFFLANGRAGVHDMAQIGLPIFLDLKLHDIPNTVAKAIQALGDLSPAVLTVHAAGGRAMLRHTCAATRGASGSPLLARGPDGAWGVVGISSTAQAGVSGGAAVPAGAIDPAALAQLPKANPS